jgi:predicted nucleotidyltransferase
MTTGLTLPTKQILLEVLEPFEGVQAAALYGSVARGDSEAHSDIDLLLLCNSGQKRDLYDGVYPVLSRLLERLSLSVYSPREINFLSKAQSLFLLHLKRESHLVFDRTGLLTSTLENFTPKASYRDDFERSLELFVPLRTSVLGAPNNLHRLSYLYSLFRIYGVYLLAEHRVFEFSKARMAAHLEAICPGESSTISLLSQLRSLNANFFSGGEFDSDFLRCIAGPLPKIEICARALGAIAGSPFSIVPCSYQKAVDAFIEEAQEQSARLSYRLRTWFLLLVYDGLNLFFVRNNNPELKSFNAARLEQCTSSAFPKPIREAALESLEYLRNYPLKYFLLEESKISVVRACAVLDQLAKLDAGAEPSNDESPGGRPQKGKGHQDF